MQRVVMRRSHAATVRARPLQNRALAAADETACRLPCVTRHTDHTLAPSVATGFAPALPASLYPLPLPVAGLENSPTPLDPPRPCTDAGRQMPRHLAFMAVKPLAICAQVRVIKNGGVSPRNSYIQLKSERTGHSRWL